MIIKNKIQTLVYCCIFILSFFTSTTYAELKLPSGADRRPNLSVDPFERAREAMRKLPKSEPEPTVETEEEKEEEEVTHELAEQPAATMEQNNRVLPPTIVSSTSGNDADSFTYGVYTKVDALSIGAGGIPNTTENSSDAPTKTGILGIVNIDGYYNTGFWNNGLFYLKAAMFFGKSPSVGDIHRVSGLSTGQETSAFRLVEFWYKHTFPFSHSSILFGARELGKDFYVSKFARLFVNDGFDLGQVLVANGNPSHNPVPTIGVVFKTNLSKKSYFQLAVHSAKPSDKAYDKIFDAKLPSNDEVFVITEFGLDSQNFGESGYYKAGIGLWYLRKDTNGFLDSAGNTILTETKPGNSGIYVIAEMAIGEKLGIFFKHGRGKKEFSQFSQFYSAGLNYIGLIPGREKDILGFGLVHTRQSSAFLAVNDNLFVAETAFEITYTTQLTNWLSVQPDFQYIQQPSMNITIPNAMVMGVRVSATF